MRCLSIALLSLALAGLIRCSDSSGPGEQPTVSLTAPAEDVSAEIGTVVPIRYLVDDPDSDASTDLLIDVDGDPATTADQTVIATGLTKGDGTPQEYGWSTAGAPLGTYSILARTDDGANPVVTGQAAGRVALVAPAPPTVEIRFPPPHSMSTTHDGDGPYVSDRITVSGQAADLSGVAAVSVNGVAATSSDGFANWSAVVPLVTGMNTITVAAEDAVGNRATDAAGAALELRDPRRSFFQPGMVGYDPARDAAVVLVDDGLGLISVDLASKEITPLADLGSMAGSFVDLEVDAANDRALLLVTSFGSEGGFAIYAFDFGSGAMTTLAESGVGDGPVIEDARAFALDGQRVLVSHDGNGPALTFVELTTGDRTLVSGPDRGDGPPFRFGSIRTGALSIDPGGGRAFCSGQNAGLLEVDLETGDRVDLVAYGAPWPHLVFDAERNLVYSSGRNLNRIWSIDPETKGVVQGQQVDPDIQGLAIGSGGDQLLMTTAGEVSGKTALGMLHSVALPSGDRTTIIDSGFRSGPHLGEATDLVLDSHGNRVLVLDSDPALATTLPYLRGPSAVIAVELGTGDRSTLLEINEPGWLPDNPIFLEAAALDASGDLLWIQAEYPKGLFWIDLESGLDFPLASITPGWRWNVGLAVDEPGNRLFLLGSRFHHWPTDTEFGENGVLLSVDMDTGDYAILSDGDEEAGLDFLSPRAALFDAPRNRVLYGDAVFALPAVDLPTGVRFVVSGPLEGGGAPMGLLSIADHDLDVPNDRVIIDAWTSILAVDLDDGHRTVISGEGDDEFIGTGPELRGYHADPRIAVDPANQTAIVLVSRRLFVVDLVSGDRVILTE